MTRENGQRATLHKSEAVQFSIKVCITGWHPNYLMYVYLYTYITSLSLSLSVRMSIVCLSVRPSWSGAVILIWFADPFAPPKTTLFKGKLGNTMTTTNWALKLVK